MPSTMLLVAASASAQRTRAGAAPTDRPSADATGPGSRVAFVVAGVLAGFGLGAVLGMVLALVVGRSGIALPAWFGALIGATYLAVAAIAYLRGRGRIGLLLLAVGAAWIVADLPATGLMAAAPAGFLVHLLLAWPDGRLRGWPDRLMVLAAHAVALVVLPVASRLGWWLPAPWHLLVVGAGAVLVVLARRWVAGTRSVPRLVVPGGAAGLVIGAGVVASVIGFPLTVFVQGAALALPLIHLAATARDRLGRTVVIELVRQLPRTPPDQVERLLREALRDPSLRIVAGTPGGELVDAAGQPVDPGSAARTELPRIGRQHMFLLHDPALLAEQPALDAVAAAAALALDNQLLAAEVRAQLAEVRASRARVVAAADEGRRLIERDLHDGAQQHLVTVSLVLRMARDRLAADPQGVDGLLERVADGLDAALLELRELARGIHPAVLTESGLIPALQAMAARSVQQVDVVSPDTAEIALDPTAELPPLPAPIAATAYFVAAEAVTNAAKHAAARRVHVQVRRTADRLLVTVVDDGVGGAVPGRGTGLAGLRDRVAAVGGELTVHSPPGAGTTVHAELPLELP